MVYFSDGHLLKLRTDLNKSNKAAYAEGTRRNFRVQWESYLLFCAYFNFVSLPTTTETLQLYAQFLSRTFKSTDSIRNYINGVKSMHLLLGYSVEHINRFILGLSLKGIAKLNPYCRKQAEPITPALLVRLASCLNFAKKNDIVFWCLFLFAFFLLARKVNKGAKIRNRYNQVPHLTQDTNGKVTNSQKTPQTRAKRSALSQQVTTKHI